VLLAVLAGCLVDQASALEGDLLPPGCDDDDDCNGNSECSQGLCISSMTEEERQEFEAAEESVDRDFESL